MLSFERLQELTEQQAEICLGIGRLKPYAGIASELDIAEATVKQYANKIVQGFDGSLTDEQRDAGPYKLILYWMAKGDGIAAERARIAMERAGEQSIDSLALRVVEAKADAKRALELLARAQGIVPR